MTNVEQPQEALQQAPLTEKPQVPAAEAAESADANAASALPVAEETNAGTQPSDGAAEDTAARADETADAEPQPTDSAQPEAAAPTEKPQPAYETKADIIARLKQMATSDTEVARQEIDSLKSHFYRIQKQQGEDAYKAYIDGGGNPDTYQPEPNADETEFKQLMAAVREKRAAQAEADEREKEENYRKKVAIIDKIKSILATPEEVNRSYNDFKALQQEWNDIKNVPAEKSTDLWKTYQANVEQFYDTLKLNNEFRAYDFKKNLELKTALCEKAEALAGEADVVAAFRQLQLLHQQFREIGPVERDLREGVWTRFKAASTAVNKRHQEYFETRKAQEQENLEKKTALCEQVEAIELDRLKTFAEWNAASEKVIALQAEWKSIGYATQKSNVKIFERFRVACDHFFTRKNSYFKEVRDSLNDNLRLKQELCEQAEALKDSTAWRETTDTLVALQKRWREIGTVPKRYSDEIWKRFNSACDAFFEAKKAATGTQYAEQKENLEKKRAIIASLEAIDPDTAEGDIRPQLRQAQADWSEVGHVPFKEKENVYRAFRAQMDRLYNSLGERASQRRVSHFRSEVKDADGRVRDKLLRQYDILKSEINTYENNLGFLTLSSKSKSGSALVEELNRKVEKLRADLNELKQKIAALDEKKEEA